MNCGLVILPNFTKKLIIKMNIPFLSLKDVTALHGDEINAAVSRVVKATAYIFMVNSRN